MNTTKLIALVATALVGFSGFGLAATTTWTNDGFITGTEAGKVLPYAYMSAAEFGHDEQYKKKRARNQYDVSRNAHLSVRQGDARYVRCGLGSA